MFDLVNVVTTLPCSTLILVLEDMVEFSFYHCYLLPHITIVDI